MKRKHLLIIIFGALPIALGIMLKVTTPDQKTAKNSQDLEVLKQLNDYMQRHTEDAPLYSTYDGLHTVNDVVITDPAYSNAENEEILERM